MPYDVRWQSAVWNEINDAVIQEVAKVRIAQKVFPTTVFDNDPTEVLNDVISFSDLTIQEGGTKQFVELTREFKLTSAQVTNEGEKKAGKTLARMAAKDIALAEDTVFFQGEQGELPEGVVALQRASAGGGLVGAAARTIPVPKLENPRDGLVYGENTFATVAEGIARLTADGQAPEYALLLNTEEYADAHVPPAEASLVTTADRIRQLVLGGFYGTGTLPAKVGLLAALGGEPTTLYVGREGAAEFVQQTGATHVYRVAERVQFVARDPRALVKLAFE